MAKRKQATKPKPKSKAVANPNRKVDLIEAYSLLDYFEQVDVLMTLLNDRTFRSSLRNAITYSPRCVVFDLAKSVAPILLDRAIDRLESEGD